MLKNNLLILALFSFLLSACGGSGGVRSIPNTPNPPIPPVTASTNEQVSNIYGSDTIIEDGRPVYFDFGWGHIGQQNDEIRKERVTVLSPASVPTPYPVTHVGDPSVSINSDGTYTMFYTVCKNTCIENTTQNDNEIWSAISLDRGLTWVNHKPVVLDPRGAAEPSAIKQGDNWVVFFTFRLEPSRIYIAKLNANRDLTEIKPVYFDNQMLGALTGVDVSNYQDRYVMCLNVHRGKNETYRLAMACIESYELEQWTQPLVIRIDPVSGNDCSATTPDLGALNLTGMVRYAVATRQGSHCSLTNHREFREMPYI